MTVTVLPKILEIQSVRQFGSALDAYGDWDWEYLPYDAVAYDANAYKEKLWTRYELVIHELMHARLLGIRVFGDLDRRTTDRNSKLLDLGASQLCWQNEAQTVAGCIQLMQGSPIAKAYPATAITYALPADGYPSESTFRRMMKENPEQTAEAVDFCKKWLVRRKFIKIEGSK